MSGARPLAPVGWLASSLALAACAVACGTVDLGASPADVNACRPNQAFFYDQVWPGFIDKDYGGKRCGDSRCHDGSSGRALTLPKPTSTWTDRTMPMPMDWLLVWKSVTEQLQCTSVSSSPLIARPSGRQTHGGGVLIAPEGSEETLVKMWVNQK